MTTAIDAGLVGAKRPVAVVGRGLVGAAHFEDSAFRDYVRQNIPLGRMASVDEVAAAALYLASRESSMVTGTSLLVDGGRTAK